MTVRTRNSDSVHGEPYLCEIGGCRYEPHLWICQNVIKQLRLTAYMVDDATAIRLTDTYRRTGLTEAQFGMLPDDEQAAVYALIKLTIERLWGETP